MTQVNQARFLKACRREPVDATPVWFMRQAGRYMPEYRAIRDKVSMLDSIRTPAIAAEITLQPINAFDLDAAIIFADILTPLIGMGITLDFIKGEGPQIENPIRSRQDIDRLTTPPTEEALPFALEAVRLATAELTPRGIPLIGFAGAPFTLASYAIEGGGSKNYERTKGLMYDDPASWAALMDKLGTVISSLLMKQVEASASALQLFDSWAGALSPRDYARYVAPYTARIIADAKKTGVPVIYFSTGTTPYLDQLIGLNSDVLSLDWRVDLESAWRQIGEDRAVQGNLDPVMLLASWESVRAGAVEVLHSAGGRPGHIFNLGHGILPGTPVDNVRRLADFVHEQTVRVAPH
jgi:uroporphyrinogen decarboxylase